MPGHWTEKLQEGPAVVVLDGKNGPHASCQQLLESGFDAHIFVAQANGSHRDTPEFKGGDFSDEFREGELAAIEELHRRKGVEALFIEPSMFTTEREIAEVMRCVRTWQPPVKIIGVGSQRTLDCYEEAGQSWDERISSIYAHSIVKELAPLGIVPNARGRTP